MVSVDLRSKQNEEKLYIIAFCKCKCVPTNISGIQLQFRSNNVFRPYVSHVIH